MSDPSTTVSNSWWWCRCSTTVSGGGPTETELYRDSFKYFKSYGGLSLSELPLRPPPEQLVSPKCVRKKGRKSGGELTSQQDKPDHEKKNGKNGSGGDVEGILLRHPGDHGCPSVRDSILERKIQFEESCKCYKMWGLRSPESWKVVELTFPSGLIVIKNPFTPAGQRYWISQTLLDYPHHPQYITNMDNLNRLERKKNGQSGEKLEDFKLDTCGRDFYEKLRWVTFGYHHDWDTKVYTEERRSKFPEDLADMTRYISQILGFEGFEAEAAIANYYHMDSTLSGHVDRSEVNQGAPLFSLSFGQTAIFLIGGKTKMDRPQPVLLESGDIAIMSGESRLSYHGVPKILPANSKSWEEESISSSDQDNFVVPRAKSCKRAKMDEHANNKNAPNQEQEHSVHDCVSFNASLKDPDITNKMENVVWNKFLNNYINKSRINLNIRQVLFPGQNDLYSSVTKS